MTRLSPGGGCLIIAQRWHDEDLTGHVLAQRRELLNDGAHPDEIDDWKIVNYPAIAEGDVQAINYFVAQKYVEALKEFAGSPNQKLLMLPMESTGVLGALAGIAELAREAGQRQPGAATPPKLKQPPVA